MGKATPTLTAAELPAQTVPKKRALSYEKAHHGKWTSTPKVQSSGFTPMPTSTRKVVPTVTQFRQAPSRDPHRTKDDLPQYFP